MRKLIILLFAAAMFTGCSTIDKNKEKLVQLESQLQYNNYEIRVQGCFIRYHECVFIHMLDKPAIKRCDKSRQTCVINVTKMFDRIRKATRERNNVK